ncbi:hypothetical protein [Nocardioides sp.]|uniref:hypothetical protein n=1 Tax=Nocardioides sp. TaxID=35761 RepID=UPI002734D812|nr:hypothetical protein [Nocardioides sp.]MDP3890682.1 hypothetical protein [Nocardioides sp.]
MDQSQAPTSERTLAGSGRLRDRLSTPTGLVAVALVAGLGVGYLTGQGRSHLHETEVACLSAPGVMSCGPIDAPGRAEYLVPKDVAWTQDGAYHSGGRPDCLPPTGRGAVEVRVTWTEVDFGGVTSKRVVGVHC